MVAHSILIVKYLSLPIARTLDNQSPDSWFERISPTQLPSPPIPQQYFSPIVLPRGFKDFYLKSYLYIIKQSLTKFYSHLSSHPELEFDQSKLCLKSHYTYFQLIYSTIQYTLQYSKHNDILLPLFSKKSRKHLYSQLLLGLKSVFMGIWQHWSYQMFSVIVMLFMEPQVIAAQHICINIVSIFHVIPIALAMAFSVYIGNMVGAKRIREAREYVKLSSITGTVWGLICGAIMVIFKYPPQLSQNIILL